MMAAQANLIDPWDREPAAGTRLHIWEVMKRMGLSLNDIRRDVRLSKTALHGLTACNLWPRRVSGARLKAQLCDLMRKHGATDDEIATLFFARRGAIDPARRGRVAKPGPQEVKSEAPVLLPKQTLTLQAKKHFKLFVNPFEGQGLFG